MEKESEIQTAICDYLALKKYFFWRQNTSPTVQISGDKWHFRRMSKYALRGVPDIILIKEGKAIFLEVKTKKGVLSDVQIEFSKRAILAGAEYFVVRSIEDVIQIGL
jgi:hypothetical protein